MASNSPGQNSTLDSLEGSRAPRIIFLLLFMLASLIGSIFIVIVLIHNSKLRNVQNLLIANICVVCIIDSLSNMSLVLGALIADDWVFGDFMCKVNNFFMNLTSIETVLLLTALSIDRYFSIRFTHKYEVWLSSYRLGAVVTYLWLHSLTFSIPFLTEAVESTFRPQLHVCTVTGQTSLAFLCSTLLICFLGPLITIIVFHVINFRVSCKLRYVKQAELAQKNYTQMTNESPPPDHDTCPSYYIYTITLFILWLVLELPFIITSYIKLYEYSQELEEGSVIDYPWEVDATFIWLRFFFSALFPLITFFCKKEIWQSAKECFLCRRNNSIVDMDIVGMASDFNIKKENNSKPEKETSTPKSKEKDKGDSVQTLAFNVPVLFATSTGICIEDPYNSYNVPIAVQPTSDSNMFELKGKTLDITYPECPDELFGDTSDYDSSYEIDQYSSSQPVSSRNVQSSITTIHRTRSLSDPEINQNLTQVKVVRQKVKHNKELSGTSGADSGLDLSGTACSSLDRKQKSKSNSTPASDIPSPSSDIMTTESLQKQVPELELQNYKINLVKSKEPTDVNASSPSTYVELESNITTVVEKNVHLPHRLQPLDKAENKTKRKNSKSQQGEGCSSVESSPHTKQSQSRSRSRSKNHRSTRGKDKVGPNSRSQSAHRVKDSS